MIGHARTQDETLDISIVSQHTVAVLSCDQASVKDNVVGMPGLGFGVCVNHSKDVMTCGNRIFANRIEGINYEDATGMIANNDVYCASGSHDDGISVWGNPNTPGQAPATTVTGNRIRNPGSCAIGLADNARSCLVTGNLAINPCAGRLSDPRVRAAFGLWGGGCHGNYVAGNNVQFESIGLLTGSFTIGTGSKTFNKAGEIEDIAVGAIVRIVSDINSPANFMAGAVTAVTGTTITVNVDEVGGSGAFAVWYISLGFMNYIVGEFASDNGSVPFQNTIGPNNGPSGALGFALAIGSGSVVRT